MKVLLTGACGLVGRPLFRELCALGYEVIPTDLPHPLSRSREHEVVEGCVPASLTAREDCERVVQGCDAIVHLANHPAPNPPRPLLEMQENICMNANLFSAALEAGIRRVVFSSSIFTVMGDPMEVVEGRFPIPDRFPLDLLCYGFTGCPYGVSKKVTESLLEELCSAYSDLVAVSLRLPSMRLEDRALPLKKFLEYPPRRRQIDLSNGMAAMVVSDLARLVDRCLQVAPVGHRVYAPASRRPSVEGSPEELISRFFPQARIDPSRRLLDSLIDLTALKNDLDWEPEF